MRVTPGWRPGLTLQVLAVVIASAGIVWFAQRPARGMYDYDGRYHVRYSELLRRDLAAGRGFPSEFPWWQETFLARRWADKDLLYHLLLIPFTFGDLEAGGKKASIAFATGLYLCLFLALRCARARAPALWTLACLLSSTTLLYRAGIVRSHVVAISLALIGAAAILRSSRLGIFLASAAYAMTHIAWHLLPGIAVLADATRSLRERRLRLGATGLSLAGTGLAIAISPHFPANLRLWWVQNVTVPAMAWSGAVPDLDLGREMLAGSPSLLIYYNLGPVIFTLAGVCLWLASLKRAGAAPEGGSRQSDVALPVLGAVALTFLALSLMSRRFVEFWAPFSVMFAAVAASHRRPERIRPARLAVAGSALLLAGAGVFNIGQTRRLVGEDPSRMFDTCSSWIRDHVPPGQTIFTTSWDEFPELFFTAPAQRYLVGLDPTFMYVTDAGRWKLWRDIALGRLADIHEPIERTFGSHYLFAAASEESFIERADLDPWLRSEARGADCAVYSLRDMNDEEPGTKVSAWSSDPGGSVSPGPRGFVDVEALGSAARSGAGDAGCAVLRARFTSPRAGSLTMAVSTDDTMKVEVNGRAAYDSALAEAPSLAVVVDQQRAGTLRWHERSFVAEVNAGYNDLVVTTCRSGNQWGFFFRIPARR